MSEEERKKRDEELRESFSEYQAAFARMGEKYTQYMEEQEYLKKKLQEDATKATISAAGAAKWSARAAWASFAVAVLSLVFQVVPALLDALRFASKQ